MAIIINDQQLSQWFNHISEAKQFSEVISTCMEICGTIKAQFSQILKCSKDAPPKADAASAGNGAEQSSSTVHDNLTRRLYNLMWASDISHSHRKHIAKAAFSLCRNMCDFRRIIQHPRLPPQRLIDHKPEVKSVLLYGMLHSTFFIQFGTDPTLADMPDQLHELFCLATATYETWFLTVAECVLVTIERPHDFHGWPTLAPDHIWRVALVNFESTQRGVRETMLSLVRSTLARRDEQFTKGTVVPALHQWNWLNRNKYHVLALLLRELPLETVIATRAVHMVEIENALIQSVRYKHLFSGARALLRELPHDIVCAMAAKVCRGDLTLLRSATKYWFTGFPAKVFRDVFALLELDECGTGVGPPDCPQEDQENERLFLLANLFRREFSGHRRALEQLLERLYEVADAPKPISTGRLSLLIKTLTYHTIHWQGEPTGRCCVFNKLEMYILQALEIPDCMNLCNAVYDQCRLLLDKFADARVPQLIYRIYERYLQPSSVADRTPTYHQTITALRLFSLLVQRCFQFCPNAPHELADRTGETIAWIAELRWDESSGEQPEQQLVGQLHTEVMQLTYLMDHSPYEDVRSVTCSMLYNVRTGFCSDTVQQLIGLHRTRALDQYSVLLRTLGGEVRDALQHLTRDPYAYITGGTGLLNSDRLYAVQQTLTNDQYNPYVAGGTEANQQQLYQLVEHVGKVCFGFPSLLDGTTPATIDALIWVNSVVGSVVYEVLGLLNAAATTTATAASDDDAAPLGASESDFEVMDRSMQLLIERSPCRPDDTDASSFQVAMAKRIMLALLCRALRVVAEFTKMFANWLLDHPAGWETISAQTVEQLLVDCIERFSTVLLRCCHFGVLDPCATCLEQVVRRIQRDKISRRHLRMSPEMTQPERHIQRLFREMLGSMPQQQSNFRRERGYLFLLHSIMKADADPSEEGSLLRQYLDTAVRLGVQDALPATTDMLVVHQLNLLAKDSSLRELLLPYTDKLLVLALQAFGRPHWPDRNAAMQLYTACLRRLAGQQQTYSDPRCDWPPVYVSLDEIIHKLPHTIHYFEQQLLLQQAAPDAAGSGGSGSSLLLLFEFLTHFEYRSYDDDGPRVSATVDSFRSFATAMLGHQHDAVRSQAARCYAQLHISVSPLDADRNRFLHTMEHLLQSLFAAECAANRRHGLCLAVLACTRRYITLRNFTIAPEGEAKDDTLATLQQLVVRCSGVPSSSPSPPSGSSPFPFRTALLRFLRYIEFDRTYPDAVRHWLFSSHPNDHGKEVFLMLLQQDSGTMGDNPRADIAMPYEDDSDMAEELDEDD